MSPGRSAAHRVQSSPAHSVPIQPWTLRWPDGSKVTVLADAIGISIQNLSVLKTGKARAMRFSTPAAICRELDCQPGDILEYVAGEESDGDTGEGS